MLATIQPSFVLGPLLGPDPGLSSLIVSRLLDGSAPFAPRLSFDIVDVRDVAALHLAAMERPEAGGRRYVASAGPVLLPDLAADLRTAFPDFTARIPRLAAPDWTVRLYALFDADVRASLRSLDRRWPGYDAAPAAALPAALITPARGRRDRPEPVDSAPSARRAHKRARPTPRDWLKGTASERGCSSLGERIVRNDEVGG